jgi:hypothetical protein
VRQAFENINLIKTPFGLPDDASHTLILVQSIGPFYWSDNYHVHLKTLNIQHAITNAFTCFELNEVNRLFRPTGAVFARNLFEGLAIRFTSGQPPNRLCPLARMTQVTSARGKFHSIHLQKNLCTNGTSCRIVFKCSHPQSPSMTCRSTIVSGPLSDVFQSLTRSF